MRTLHRRALLTRVGAPLAGSGAVLGSSAFDSVRADRTVSLETAGDADALLGLKPVPDGEEYLVGDIIDTRDSTLEASIPGELEDSVTLLARDVE